RFASHSKYLPLLHRNRAKIFVELNSRLIPIQDGPFESPAVALARNPGQRNEHRPSESFTAHFRNDEQVFEIQARPAEKCRKIVEEYSECDRFIAEVTEQDLGVGPRPEK